MMRLKQKFYLRSNEFEFLFLYDYACLLSLIPNLSALNVLPTGTVLEETKTQMPTGRKIEISDHKNLKVWHALE